MRIRIDLKIFVFIVLFYLTKQIEIYAMLMIFALLHECGHLIAGLIMGFKPEKINVMPIGLAISFKIPIENYNKKIEKSNILSIKKIIIALAGPIINILIALVVIFMSFGFTDVQRLNIIYANVIICIFNLLPIYPLDGGRILKQFIKIKKGIIDSLQYTYIIQNVLMIILTFAASIAIYYLENISILIIIMYLWILVLNENKKYSVRKRIYNCIKENK